MDLKLQHRGLTGTSSPSKWTICLAAKTSLIQETSDFHSSVIPTDRGKADRCGITEFKDSGSLWRQRSWGGMSHLLCLLFPETQQGTSLRPGAQWQSCWRSDHPGQMAHTMKQSSSYIAFQGQNVTCCKAAVSLKLLQMRHFRTGEGLVHSNHFYSSIAQKGLNRLLDHLEAGWTENHKCSYQNSPNQLLLSDFPLLPLL